VWNATDSFAASRVGDDRLAACFDSCERISRLMAMASIPDQRLSDFDTV
jgi:hypothetical protein